MAVPTDRSRVRFDLGRDPRGPRQVREHRDEEEPSDGHGGDQEPQRVPATLVRGLMGEDRVELVLIEQFDEARRDDDARTEEPEAETEDLVGGDDPGRLSGLGKRRGRQGVLAPHRKTSACPAVGRGGAAGGRTRSPPG